MTEQSYQQPTKDAARRMALEHAVEVLTTRRNEATVAPEGYVRHVIDGLRKNGLYQADMDACAEDDIEAWDAFRQSSVGVRAPEELTVAYLTGPEPLNDLKVLVSLGVRPENIWGFETKPGPFASALTQLQASGVRGFKLMQVDIQNFIVATPRRFDIIYFDACGPLPSDKQKTTRTLSTIFRQSALAPFGVLITNFSRPDISKPHTSRDYSSLVAAYLYPKAFLDAFDCDDQTFTDGAVGHGWDLFRPDTDGAGGTDEESFEADKAAPDAYFADQVSDSFDDYYGSFITRHVMDIAAIVAPATRLANSKLWSALFAPVEEVLAQARKDEEDGDAAVETEMASLWFTLMATVSPPDGMTTPAPNGTQEFLKSWAGQLTGLPENGRNISDIVRAFYTCQKHESLWRGSLRDLAGFEYGAEMPMFCDVPNSELAFYPSFAQLAFPSHCNVAEAKRYAYTAEGKDTRMYLDVLPFDECRYIYDWLSSPHLFEQDWRGLSAQIVFRASLDAVAKMVHWYQREVVYGCHVAPINYEGFDAHQLSRRVLIDVGAPEAKI
jgi:hypothetical protein